MLGGAGFAVLVGFHPLVAQAIGEVQAQHRAFPLVVKTYMYFKVDKEMVKVYLRDILWIESLKDT